MKLKSGKKAFLIRMAEEELSVLDSKVSRTQKSREQFVRDAANGCSIFEKPPAEYGEIIKQLRRIGTNIDQLLVVARVKGFMDELKLKNIAEQVDRMDRMFVSSFSIKR